MNNKIKSTLIGGGAIGILSLIPIVSALNLVCCAWAILGGGLAAYIYIKDSTNPVQMGEGALAGGLAGVLGAFILLIVTVPLMLFMGVGAQYEQMLRQAGLREINIDINVLLVGIVVFQALIMVIMAAVGGVIGTKIFEKRNDQAAPPVPPPNFGDYR